jgi:hypothetical protein
VTEAEWMACTEPQPMLEFLRGKVSDRKLRLFACACCRRYWRLPEDEHSRTAVEVAERYVDGQATTDDLLHACAYADGCAGDDYINRAFACASEREASVGAIQVSTFLVEAASAEVMAAVADDTDDYLAASDAACRIAYVAERSLQCRLIRDVCGDPFRHVTVAPSWPTPALVELAQNIYDQRAFDRMPKLADALERAGCDNAEVLAHCRQPGEHVRGCWVVDLILGKE